MLNGQNMVPMTTPRPPGLVEDYEWDFLIEKIQMCMGTRNSVLVYGFTGNRYVVGESPEGSTITFFNVNSGNSFIVSMIPLLDNGEKKILLFINGHLPQEMPKEGLTSHNVIQKLNHWAGEDMSGRLISLLADFFARRLRTINTESEIKKRFSAGSKRIGLESSMEERKKTSTKN